MNNSVHVGVSDLKIEKIAKEIISRCYTLGKRELVISEFKKLLIDKIENNDNCNISTEKILITFDSLTEEEKTELLNKCTVEYTEHKLENSIFDIESNQKDYLDTIYPRFEQTPEELKKRIKYAKNPFEKRLLQKELSSINAFNGKHRNGSKSKK